MLGQKWQALVHPEDKEAYVGEFLTCVRERRPFRGKARVKRADGQWRWVDSFGIPQFIKTGEFLGIVGTSPDITESKQAEEKLLQARSELERERNILRAIMNGARNCHLAYLDRDYNFVRVNETFAAACGYTPNEMVGRNHFALYPHAENEAIFTQVRDTGISAEFHDKPFSYPDQPKRQVSTHWDWTLIPDKDDKGNVLGLVFALFETSQRVKAEEALRVSEERLRLIGDNLPDSAVYQYSYQPNGESKFLYVSAGIERVRGVSVRNVLSDAGILRSQILAEYQDKVNEEEQRSIEKFSDFDLDVPARLPDGELRWIWVHSRPRRMPNGHSLGRDSN